MKRLAVTLALLALLGAFSGCCNDPCDKPNPCDPCVAEPVYRSPCCPQPSGSVDGPWGIAP